MEAVTMTRGELLKSEQIKQFLSDAVQEEAEVVVSYTRQGKWGIIHTKIASFDDETITLSENSEKEAPVTYQPVGICVQLGHFKYLFETVISSIKKHAKNCRIQLEFPEKAECMQRRVYDRQPIPSKLKVKILFWHRGYLDDNVENPKEQYWQGRLLNLSAGGAQIVVDLEMKDYFRVGQLVGVQFTPMSYQRPLLVEAHVRYLIDQADQQEFFVGIEFLGLESGPEGPKVLHRLVQVTNEYEKMNQENSVGPATV